MTIRVSTRTICLGDDRMGCLGDDRMGCLGDDRMGCLGDDRMGPGFKRLLGISSKVVLLAVGCLAAVAAGPVHAEEPEERIAAFLEAGEFAPAAKLANEVGVPAERDRMLRRIAERQASLGVRRAALATASTIGDDRIRSSALEYVGAEPVKTYGARGGGVQADFDSLIELITSTIAPQSWDDVGGPGAIQGFEGGVFVDSTGLLRRKLDVSDSRDLSDLRKAASRDGGNRDASATSVLRKVSLTRLEKQLQLRTALRQSPDETMRALAGLTRVKYVFVYPESKDVVIAGPAGDWRRDDEGRRVNRKTGEPTLHLDDLVVLLRNALEENGRFGCSITPTQRGLAATKAYLEETGKRALRPGERDKWLERIRDSLGKQDIEVYGVDPQTRVARVLVEADYRMKLVGMGLEPGVFGVVSYLDAIPANQPPASMDVLRWWFTLNYQAIRATPQRGAFELRGQGVKVLSENELLTEQGQRRHTGKSDVLNQQFVQSFTRHFDRLAATYPIYAELRNVFDLALVAALVRSEALGEQVGWRLTHWRDQDAYPVVLRPAPAQVESVINHRLINRTRIVAGVSGGVAVDTRSLVKADAIETDDYGKLQAEKGSAAPPELPASAWWWD